MTGRFEHFDARPGGSSTTFDLVLKNNPTFIANTAKHYLFIQEIGDQVANYLARGRAGFHELLTDFVTGKGTLEQKDWAWDELFAFVKRRRRRRCAIGCLAHAGRWRRYVMATMSPRSESLRPRGAPLGEIMDVRRIYSTSAGVRRTLNHQPKSEPTSADEVLAF